MIKLSLLLALGRRLDHALGVKTGGDTSDRVGFLLLQFELAIDPSNMMQRAGTYEKTLVGSLLPLPGHGVRSRVGEVSGQSKEGEADTEANSDTPGDLGVGARGVHGTRTVRTEGNPVCC